MHLPAELIDKILSHLPSYDADSLRSCSLVAKSWLGPCRRRLFKSVSITTRTHHLWVRNISPKSPGLFHHVHGLMYITWGQPCPIGDGLQNYFPSFCQLQRLTLRSTKIEPITPDHTKLFFAFQHTLLSLSLSHVSITWNGLVTLLEYFPNLRDLEICEVSFKMDIPPTPNLIHALRGRLVVQYENVDPKSFIDQFSELKLEYEELLVMGDYGGRLVAAVQDNLKHLQIAGYIWNLTLDLSGCPGLCQLEITPPRPREEELAIISSITSINFRKLILRLWITCFQMESPWYNSYWASLDDTLCGLVDRLRMSGYEHTLEVEFPIDVEDMDNYEAYQEKLLPKFKEKGRVRIAYILSGKFREWP